MLGNRELARNLSRNVDEIADRLLAKQARDKQELADMKQFRLDQARELASDTDQDEVDNPYEAGPLKIKALRSYRDDPLAVMYRRRQIDKAGYEAGRAWQALYRAAEIVSVKAMDTTKEPVDGGGNVIEALTDRKLEAMKRLSKLGAKLGQRDERLLGHVLIGGMSIREYSWATGWHSANHVRAVSWQFRQALELLAREFGYA